MLGSDPHKLKLRDDVGRAFAEGKQYFRDHPEITARQLFEHACTLAERYGWSTAGPLPGT